MIWFDKQGALIMPTGMDAWGVYWMRSGFLSWELRGGDLVRVQKSYRDGKWQTDVDTLADHSIDTCRGLLGQALLSGHQPTRVTVKAARLLREGKDAA
ncbi:MAG: hypothetical protein U0Q11_11230 [Vicinamibacterales bacterium]